MTLPVMSFAQSLWVLSTSLILLMDIPVTSLFREFHQAIMIPGFSDLPTKGGH